MDERIRKELIELGNNIAGLGRQVSSVNSNIIGLKAISKSLRKAAQAIDLYIKAQEELDKEDRLTTKE